jgi:hypothetical protein
VAQEVIVLEPQEIAPEAVLGLAAMALALTIGYYLPLGSEPEQRQRRLVPRGELHLEAADVVLPVLWRAEPGKRQGNAGSSQRRESQPA